ncbi:MAG: DNA polymerase III subunit [Planctomycetes bacterium]|nr:DNA polymerase III subunit [Planctomycetota bacterium]
MSLFDVQHQNRAHRVIQRALSCGRMPHAYLFAGPEGVGKEMLAMRLAKVLLCGSPRQVPMPDGIFAEQDATQEGMPTQSRGHGTPLTQGGGQSTPGEALDACGKCEDCILVDAGTHPDLHLIYRQLNKQHPDSTIRKQKALFLGVEIIRHFLIERAGMKPSRGRAKVFVVREAERLNESAQNALLKTLEEPPPDTFIILLTDALDRMLPTTRSRCQQVLFQSLPDEFVADRVRSLRPDAGAQQVGYAARHAGGSLGSALRLIDDGVFELKQAWGDQLAKLQSGRGVAPNELAKPFVEDAGSLAKCVAERDPEVSDTDASRVGLQTLLAALADFYMDALRRRCGANMAPINEDQPAVVDGLAVMGERALRACLRQLADADANLGRNANIELTIEAMFIGLSQGRTAVQAAGRAP